MEILKEGPGIYQTGDLVYHNGVYGNFERGRDRENIKPAISFTIVVYIYGKFERGRTLNISNGRSHLPYIRNNN
jgi:hypothetical protein